MLQPGGQVRRWPRPGRGRARGRGDIQRLWQRLPREKEENRSEIHKQSIKPLSTQHNELSQVDKSWQASGTSAADSQLAQLGLRQLGQLATDLALEHRAMQGMCCTFVRVFISWFGLLRCVLDLSPHLRSPDGEHAGILPSSLRSQVCTLTSKP